MAVALVLVAVVVRLWAAHADNIATFTCGRVKSLGMAFDTPFIISVAFCD